MILVRSECSNAVLLELLNFGGITMRSDETSSGLLIDLGYGHSIPDS